MASCASRFHMRNHRNQESLMTALRSIRFAAILTVAQASVAQGQGSAPVRSDPGQPGSVAQTARELNGRIVGRILDAAHGTPLAGAKVTVTGLQITVTSAIDGRFVLVNVPVATPVEIQ